MSDQPFQAFTSLRYDPLLLTSSANTTYSHNPSSPSPFYLLSHHRDRMLSAAQHFNWSESTTTPLQDLTLVHKTCLAAVHSSSDSKTGLRVRLLLSPGGELTAETTPTPQVSDITRFFPQSLPAEGEDEALGEWTVVLDTLPTEVSGFTGFKTTQRGMYDSARARGGISSFAETKEVLLWNADGEVMEGSLTNVFFRRGGKWVTPPLSCGGQAGTVRRYLLEKGMAEEGVVVKGEIVPGERVLLSNGVRGVWAAKVV
ncbi:D-aminoacid aminotransferase-like PLP-dependent enzyme [Choiromyces venosus 120613-1]|uniref:D-aminoacid aminotransferase-like PLP-dependent enzyme n=1 Tax=Choiromyces venosus 120613-1 TaxID=1336337 RepID=A0A3N4JE93_9PEZI|nr:D-aminoacid aminotransferase-like PLP-dependent enzyme [Choiromyces venosus 120613-1]